MPNWSQERRARAGLREASRRDKAVRSLSLHHSLSGNVDTWIFIISIAKYSLNFRTEWYDESYTCYLACNFNPLTKFLAIYLVQYFGPSELTLVSSTAARGHTN